MGYIIKTVDGQLKEYAFDIGGVLALRNFTVTTNGQRLIVRSNEKANFTILDALVNEVEIDGKVYDNPKDAQEALQKLVFNPKVPVIAKDSDLNNIPKVIEIPSNYPFTPEGIANYINATGLTVKSNEIILFKSSGGSGVSPTPGQAPVISAISNATVKTYQSISIPINVSDANASVTVRGLKGTLTYNTSTKRIEGSHSYAETLNITVTATNSAGADTKSFTITFSENVTAPVISAISNVTITETVTISPINVQVNDPNATISVTGLPRGLVFNASNKRIEGTAAVVETKNVTITATNAAGSDTKTFIIVVQKKVLPPVITPITDKTAIRYSQITPISIQVSDPNATVTVEGLKGTNLSYDPATKQITGNIPVSYSISVTVRATNSGGSDAKTFTIIVSEPNYQTTLTTSSIKDATNKIIGNFGDTITDSNIKLPLTLSGSIQNAPAGTVLKISALRSGTIAGSVTATISGNSWVANIFDDKFLSGTYKFVITAELNNSRVGQIEKMLVLDAPLFVYAGQDVALSTNSYNLKPQVIGGTYGHSFSWVKKTGGTIIFSNNQSLRSSISGLQSGSYVLELTATDHTNIPKKDEVTITVASATKFTMNNAIGRLTSNTFIKPIYGHFGDILNKRVLADNVIFSGIASKSDGASIPSSSKYVKVVVKNSAGTVVSSKNNISINSQNVWSTNFIPSTLPTEQITIEATLFVDNVEISKKINSFKLTDFYLSFDIDKTFRTNNIDKNFGEHNYGDVKKKINFTGKVTQYIGTGISMYDTLLLMRIKKGTTYLYNVDLGNPNSMNSFNYEMFPTEALVNLDRGVYDIEVFVVSDVSNTGFKYLRSRLLSQKETIIIK